MRFTLDTDASTLTHPVQLCLVATPMIVPSTYRKCIHSLSSKTVTSGYDSLIGKYKSFLPVCWFLKTDRYFFCYSISTDVSKIKFKKVPVYIRNGGYILFFKFKFYTV